MVVVRLAGRADPRRERAGGPGLGQLGEQAGADRIQRRLGGGGVLDDGDVVHRRSFSPKVIFVKHFFLVGFSRHEVLPSVTAGQARAQNSIAWRWDMPDPYSAVNLLEVEDVAPANGFSDRWQARVARSALGAQQTGVTHFRLQADKRSPFMHRHTAAEEIYVILSGSGRLKLDDEIIDVRTLDAIRIDPEV